jgi:hypothetical protein
LKPNSSQPGKSRMEIAPGIRCEQGSSRQPIALPNTPDDAQEHKSNSKAISISEGSITYLKVPFAAKA